MKRRIGCFFLLALFLLSACGELDKSPRSTQQEPYIELAIRDYKYVVMNASARIGKSTLIRVHNEDNVTHGFVPTLDGHAIRAEGAGQRVLVDGKEGFHIDPGESLTVTVVLESEGMIRFECDIHPNMADEKLFITTHRTVKSPKG